jgi:octaprenyl-diphosphate synthase
MKPKDLRLLRLLTPVQEQMARMRAVLAEELRGESPAVADMTDHLGRFKGKQLRGAVVLLAGQTTGNMTDEHATVAAIVELIHLATLVHDDVLDGAEVRRRVACVHARWDNQVAVLLGDLLYSRAFGRSTLLSSRLCSQVLSDTTRELCAGEIDQAASRYHFEMSLPEYERIAGAKTAGLYAAAAELGASYPGGSDGPGEARARMRAFGWEMGLAFQIVDDCLDLMGDRKTVGKSVGTDVEDGKVTLPVLHVYGEADEATRAAMRDVYTRPGLDQRAVRLRETCDLSAGIERAMLRARALVEAGRSRLLSFPESPARDALDRVGDYVLERKW